MAGHLRPGDVIGRQLRVLRTLGEGGYGSVYEAQPLQGGPRVAVKVMHDRLGESEVAFGRFEREVAFVQRLRHPGIVAVAGWGRTDEHLPYIAFEMLDGRTLREELDARGSLGPWHAAEVTRQILDALAHAHRGDLVHRDIKPANIFLCQRGTLDAPMVKLLDFGVARSAAGGIPTLTATGQMVGTPHYMSPEQVRGLEADPRADLYSLGVVLAEMLSGEKLLQADSDIELLLIHADEGPLRLPPVVRATPLARVVETAVRKKPDERYPSAEAMMADLEAAVIELGRMGAGPGPSWTMSTSRTALLDRGPHFAAPPAVPSPSAHPPPIASSQYPPALAAPVGAPAPPPRPRRLWPWFAAGLAAVVGLSVMVGLGVGGMLRGSRPSERESTSGRAAEAGPFEERHRALVAEVRRRVTDQGLTLVDVEEKGGGDLLHTAIIARRGPTTYTHITVGTYQSEQMAEMLARNLASNPDLAVKRQGASVVWVIGDGAAPVLDAVLP